MNPALLVASLSLATHGVSGATPARNCDQLFTPSQAHRAALVIYRGTRRVSLKNLRLLGYLERCQRNPRNQAPVRTFDRHQDELWKVRRQATAATPSTGWAIPWSIVNCESGGNNDPPNSSGASGYYQIIPSTWLSYGGGAYASQAYLASKSAQDVVAARIWDGGRGASNWSCAYIVGWL